MPPPPRRRDATGFISCPARSNRGWGPTASPARRLPAAGAPAAPHVAGERLEIYGTLHVGEAIRRRSTIQNVTEKMGKSGALVIIVVRHVISVPGGRALIEQQDLVHRQAADLGAPPLPPRLAPKEGAWLKTARSDAVMPFRHSAMKFNGHRIHYDRPYAMECEGYPGLVVYGHLVATLLMALYQGEWPETRLTAFDFRMLGPLFDIASFTVQGRPTDSGADLWAAARAARWQPMVIRKSATGLPCK